MSSSFSTFFAIRLAKSKSLCENIPLKVYRDTNSPFRSLIILFHTSKKKLLIDLLTLRKAQRLWKITEKISYCQSKTRPMRIRRLNFAKPCSKTWLLLKLTSHQAPVHKAIFQHGSTSLVKSFCVALQQRQLLECVVYQCFQRLVHLQVDTWSRNAQRTNVAFSVKLHYFFLW